MPRKYTLKRRAARQDETRRRIVEAIVALHEEIGPARTTISAIAARAGVERLTIYRHFPNDDSLFGACKARFDQQHPLPDPRPWADVADATSRLRVALTQLYGYYGASEQMLTHVFRDAPRLPVLQSLLASGAAYWEQIVGILLDGWHIKEDRRSSVAAALGHALQFQTWQSLVRQHGLTDSQAISLMVCLVTCAAGGDRTPEHRADRGTLD